MSEVLHYEMHDSTLASVEVDGDVVLLFASLAGRTLDWQDRFAPARLRLHDPDMEALARAMTWRFPVALEGGSALGPEGTVIDPAWSLDAPRVDISALELEPRDGTELITVHARAMTLTWCGPPKASITREGAASVPASHDNLYAELGKLRPHRGSTFAVLELKSGGYYQVAGGPAGMVLEKRDAAGRHYRGHQAMPVVPFEDDTVLSFSAGKLTLKRDEWFRLDQVRALFTLVATGEREPSWVRWREVTAMFERA